MQQIRFDLNAYHIGQRRRRHHRHSPPLHQPAYAALRDYLAWRAKPADKTLDRYLSMPLKRRRPSDGISTGNIYAANRQPDRRAPQRIVAAQTASRHRKNCSNARPKTLDDYIGQDKAKEQLAIFIRAKTRRSTSDHVFAFRPARDWATTLAHIIAKELGVNLRRKTSGPVSNAQATSPSFDQPDPTMYCSSTKLPLWSLLSEETSIPRSKTWPGSTLAIGEATRRPFRQNRPAAFHAHRGATTAPQSDQSVARPLRHRLPPWVLRKPRPLTIVSRSGTTVAARYVRIARGRNRQTQPRYAAHRQPPVATRARFADVKTTAHRRRYRRCCWRRWRTFRRIDLMDMKFRSCFVAHSGGGLVGLGHCCCRHRRLCQTPSKTSLSNPTLSNKAFCTALRAVQDGDRTRSPAFRAAPLSVTQCCL